MQQFRDFRRRFIGMAACAHCIDQFCVKICVLCFQRLRDLETIACSSQAHSYLGLTAGTALIAQKSGTGFAALRFDGAVPCLCWKCCREFEFSPGSGRQVPQHDITLEAHWRRQARRSKSPAARDAYQYS
ncbi:hypothetical protein [Rhizobium mongolense]|uniref:hypothetical protein n=1 Tax=Rhizobium mongolense TaxID=57676 RepID=UPI0014289C62|nr:hypothetical protein [Rhizobium mongolense]